MILVSILGDFDSSYLPLFYEFRDRLCKHIVVYDTSFSSQRANKKRVESLQKFCALNELQIDTEIFLVDEDSFGSINRLIVKLETLNDFDNVYVNTTDGLSNISILLGVKLLERGVKILSYDMYENSYNTTTLQGITTHKMSTHMSIKEHLLLKGFHVRDSSDKSFALKYEKEIRTLFEKHNSEYKELRRDVTQNRVNKSRYPKAMQLIKTMGLSTKTEQKEITGGLFEWYVYLLIKDLGFSDIEVGVIVEDSFTKESSIRNEFDILMMHENHLHMIECKFTRNIDLQALVYKYSTLLNLIDDDGRMMILTEKGPYAYDLYNSNQQGLETYRRALSNKILIRSAVAQNREQFVKDVFTYFHLL